TGDALRVILDDILSGTDTIADRWDGLKRLRAWFMQPEAMRASKLVLEGWKEMAMINAVDNRELLPGRHIAATPKPLREVLGTAQHARELRELRNAEAYDEIALRENAIVRQILTEVRKYRTFRERHRDK